MIKTCFIGDERIGWALDHEMALTQQSLKNTVRVTPFLFSTIVHAVSWQSLLNIPREFLQGRRVICHMTHDPRMAFENPVFECAARVVHLWVVRSLRAQRAFQKMGLPHVLIPYAFDPAVFFPISKDDAILLNLREKFQIPEGTYLIGSFQRDTDGADLKSPKLVKGPDIFVEAVSELYTVQKNICVLLAGPRRHWIKSMFIRENIPFVFAGREMADDDLKVNTLSLNVINTFYNLVDVYLVTSRLEGGPQAVIEAAATRCKILSTNVGHAPDLLHSRCIVAEDERISSVLDADIQHNVFNDTLDYNFASVKKCHPEMLAPLWADAYQTLMNCAPLSAGDVSSQPGVVNALARRLRR